MFCPLLILLLLKVFHLHLRSTSTPSDILSSSSDQSESESGCTDHDTVILSDENLAGVSQPSNQQASHV